MNENSTLRTVILAVAIVFAAGLLGRGIVQFRLADRYVSVKGVAERDVVADVGIWPLRFVSTADLLENAREKIELDRRRVAAFLARAGVDSSAISLRSLEVTDAQANPYRQGPVQSRYIVTMTLVVRSNDVEQLRRASQSIGELVAAGVVLSAGEYGGGGPTYLFTKLNDLKPEMLAESTANARKAAQQFALESGARVGAIRRAYQGVFEILPRDQTRGIDQSSEIRKILRVVSTLEYYLQD
jgi:hypothetical protein